MTTGDAAFHPKHESLSASAFAAPPAAYKSRPLWFWNGRLDEALTVEQIRRAHEESGYAGFGILPALGMTPDFMTPEFLAHYKTALDAAAGLGLKMCLYDEYWFPSGSAGGLLQQRYPDAFARRLDLVAQDVRGPVEFEGPLPNGSLRAAYVEGKLMAAVAMRTDTFERVNLAPFVRGNQLQWNVPPGTWRIMEFACLIDERRQLVDYLDPERVGRFIELTYEAYYRAFPEHFGTTIDSAFYDEPTLYQVKGGRCWTESFNEKFMAHRGYDPAMLYPALWFDIGPETAAARNALFSFRAKLFSDGFVKTVNDWCRQHRIELTGHVDQEEVINPTGICGDLVKIFEHQDIPGVDQIFRYQRGSPAYKVVSSAAYNHDRRLVMVECHGATPDMPLANLYKEAIDLFCKGINYMVPHAVWYEPDNPNVVVPELSYRHPLYGPELPAYNRFIARLQYLLQSGRHVADIAVLYPVAALQAAYYFTDLNPYFGGITPPEADYMDVGECLALTLRRDFTFIHPEILDAKCSVESATLRLNNNVNHEIFRVLIVPGGGTIHWSNLRKIVDFYDAGGLVIATTRLPEKSAEAGHDGDVQKAVEAMFGADRKGRANSYGGRAIFLPEPNAEALAAALAHLPVYDLKITAAAALPNGSLSYIHKVEGTRDVFLIGNSSDAAVEAQIQLRGHRQLERWDPHTGDTSPLAANRAYVQSQPVTRCTLDLPAVSAAFIVGT